MPDHVHMCIAIPPKQPVASVIGFLKGWEVTAAPRHTSVCLKALNPGVAGAKPAKPISR